MFLIPGSLMSILTFPGVIVHEIAHRFFCDLAKVPVYDVRYFKFGNHAGHVIHGEVKGIRNAFLIAIGPLIVNSLLCIILAFPLTFPLIVFGSTEGGANNIPGIGLLLYLSISIGMHAFPSNQDMKNFTNIVKEEKNKGILYLIAYPFNLLIKLANLLRFFWFDLVYAVILAVIIPVLYIGHL